MVRRSSRPLVLAAVAGVVFADLFLCTSGLAARQAEGPQARDIIDRFVQATGGVAAFKSVASMRARGTFTVVGQQLDGQLEMLAARPNRLLTRISLPGMGQFEEGFDGKVAWSIDPLRGPALVTGRGFDERADEAWFDGPLHGPEYVKSMTVVGREELDGRPVYRLKVVTVRGIEQFELFDVDTGLQVAVEAPRDTPFGVVPTTILYKEYQRFGLLTFPSRIVQKILGQEQVIVFTHYEFNTVPGNAFDLPPAVRALIK